MYYIDYSVNLTLLMLITKKGFHFFWYIAMYTVIINNNLLCVRVKEMFFILEHFVVATFVDADGHATSTIFHFLILALVQLL